MTWTRHFHFARRRRRFDGIMIYDDRRRTLVDWLGWTKHLKVDLHARADHRGVSITSGRQWIELGRLHLHLPLPGWVVGRAHVREWQRADGRLAIRVSIVNPILGPFVGYTGVFDGPVETGLAVAAA